MLASPSIWGHTGSYYVIMWNHMGSCGLEGRNFFGEVLTQLHTGKRSCRKLPSLRKLRKWQTDKRWEMSRDSKNGLNGQELKFPCCSIFEFVHQPINFMRPAEFAASVFRELLLVIGRRCFWRWYLCFDERRCAADRELLDGCLIFLFLARVLQTPSMIFMDSVRLHLCIP